MSTWATALMFIRRIFCRRNIKYHITHSAFVYPLFFDTRIDSQSIKEFKMHLHIYLVSVIILQRILSPCSLWAARSMTTTFFFFFDFPRNNLFCVCANADWWIMQTAIHSSSSVRKYRPSEPQSPVDGHHNTGHKERHPRWTIKSAPCLENHRQNDSSRRSFSICPNQQIICFYILDGPPPLPLLLSSQPIIQLFPGHFLNTDQYRLVRWNGPILSASPTPTPLDIFFAPCGRPRILSWSQHFVIARPRFDVILAVSVTTFIHQAQVPWKDPTPYHIPSLHCSYAGP